MRALFPRFLCRLIGHRRSHSGAYVDETKAGWRSICRRCGAPMRKDGLRGWQEVRD